MIGVDTNVFVRIFVDDGSAQHRAAAKLALRGELLFVSNVVVIEAAWVFARAFKLRKRQITDVLGRAVQSELFEFEDRKSIEAALTSFAVGRADFSDYLALGASRHAGAVSLYTFDRAFASEPGVELLRYRAAH